MIATASTVCSLQMETDKHQCYNQVTKDLNEIIRRSLELKCDLFGIGRDIGIHNFLRYKLNKLLGFVNTSFYSQSNDYKQSELCKPTQSQDN